MPNVSHRSEEMPTSATRKLVPFADKAKKRGTHVYHLNIGQPDIETPPKFIQAICESNTKIIAYTKSAGIDSYREKLVEYYKSVGIDFSFDDIIVTMSGSEALRFAFQVCMNPGDEIILPEPFYTNYNSIAIDSGVTIKPLWTDINNNFDLPKIEEFEKVIGPKTKAILICNPTNPTGKLYSQEDLEKIKEIAIKYNLFIIADEVYREFCYDGLNHFSAMNLKGVDDNVILVDSISKRYSACGARLGCLVSKNKKIMESVLKFAQSRLAAPTLEQIGAEALIDTTPESYFVAMKEEYQKRRDVLVEELSKIEGVKVPKISGAFYAIVELPVDDCEKFGIWMLEEFEFEGATTMIAPGSGFYTNPELGKKQVRIAYVLEEVELRKAIKCLAEGIKVYNSVD